MKKPPKQTKIEKALESRYLVTNQSDEYTFSLISYAFELPLLLWSFEPAESKWLEETKMEELLKYGKNGIRSGMLTLITSDQKMKARWEEVKDGN